MIELSTGMMVDYQSTARSASILCSSYPERPLDWDLLLVCRCCRRSASYDAKLEMCLMFASLDMLVQSS